MADVDFNTAKQDFVRAQQVLDAATLVSANKIKGVMDAGKVASLETDLTPLLDQVPANSSLQSVVSNLINCMQQGRVVVAAEIKRMEDAAAALNQN